MMMMRTLGMIGVAASLACTVDGSDNDPFGATTVPSTSVTTVGTTTPATGESSSSAGSDSSGTAGSSESSSSGGGESSTGADEASSSGSADDTTGGGNGMQPADGMYSSCAVAMDCGVVPALCITITDMMMQPLGGFCSETGCTNPAMSCDPSPGGTATPICMAIDVSGAPAQACALDCSGGKICPLPMQCQPLASAMVCA
jgi:hypothetical protein